MLGAGGGEPRADAPPVAVFGEPGEGEVTSDGWKADVLTWDRASGAGEPAEEFIYRRLGDGRMQIDWMTARAGQPLVLGDTLTCDKG